MDQNKITEFLTDLLKAKYPLMIENIVKNEENKRIDIYLKIEGDHRLSADYHRVSAYKDRTWRHLDWFEYSCYLHCDLPKYRHKTSKKVLTLDLELSRKEVSITKVLDYKILELLKIHGCLTEVAKALKLYPQLVETTYHYYTDKAYEDRKVSPCTQVGVDETSTRKGHNYITTFVDMDKHKIIDIQDNRDSKAVSEFAKNHPDPSSVNQVSLDMSVSYRSAFARFFSQAKQTFDRWHVYKHIFKGLYKKHKAGILSGEILAHLKQELDGCYEEKDVSEMAARFTFWIDYAADQKYISGQMVKWLKNHFEGIVNYAESRLTNGLLEGINSKIQVLKRKARGFRYVENFKQFILFIFGTIEPKIKPVLTP